MTMRKNLRIYTGGCAGEYANQNSRHRNFNILPFGTPAAQRKRAMITQSQPKTVTPDPKTLKILAKSIFKELRSQGYDSKQVVSLATELISLVTSELQGQ
jgi:hypothetical protein